MRGAKLVPGVLCVLLLAACGSGEGTSDDALSRPRPSTTVAPTTTTPAGACGLRPLTFTSERWQGTPTPSPRGPGIVWEQTYTFSNPNTVPVRLSSLVPHLRLTGSGGYFLKMARGAFQPVPDELVPAAGSQQRVARAWLAAGNAPSTEELFATASAAVSGQDCAVAVERISTSPVPAHVLALVSCDPEQAPSAC
jgi:hypothetical protein